MQKIGVDLDDDLARDMAVRGRMIGGFVSYRTSAAYFSRPPTRSRSCTIINGVELGQGMTFKNAPSVLESINDL